MFQRPGEPDIHSEFLIIGAGVAGITLANKLAELGKQVWLLGSPYESQLAKAGLIQNTDLPKGTIGLKFIEELINNAKSNGVNHKSSLVTKIIIKDVLLIETSRQKFYPKIVIIATGCKQAKIGFSGEKEFFHKGISDCSICDFPLYKSKIVGVLGNHEYTKRAANFLINETKGVHLFWYNEENKPEIDDRITLHMISSIEAQGDELIEKVSIETNDGSYNIPIQGLFVEGKPIPSSNFLKESKIKIDLNGYIITDDDFKTNIENIFAIGDVTGKTSNYREVMDNVKKILKIVMN